MNEINYATKWEDVVNLPVSTKQQLRELLRNISISTLSTFTSHKNDNFLRLLYCHYVFDNEREKFREIIDNLKMIGEFVNTDTCIEMIKGEKEIDKKYFHLSFDDGFRNIFLNALPTLRDQNIPAIIFVPTDIISTDYEMSKYYWSNNSSYNDVIEMMTWQDICEADSWGFEIGSHTKTHARFSKISKSNATMKNEILGSKLDIENEIGKECKYISWPFRNKISCK